MSLDLMSSSTPLSRRLGFKVEAEVPGSRARATTFKTLHNEVQTPIFMPVGTQGTVRYLRREDLQSAGAQVLLANTYHLLLRPGVEVFKKFGGLHNFMKWPKSLLTDSGGFQIFSLPDYRKMTEEGAVFRSHIDGSIHMLSPEVSIATQRAIGSDIMMSLDECVPSTVDHARAKEAMDLTHRWAPRNLAARGDSPQSLFGIVQGACYTDLRKESAQFLSSLPFDGLAIGGLAVGEGKNEREDTTALVTEYLPRDLPRYLMGVGTPLDLLEAVHRGVDMFDCIIPTQHAEQGVAYTSEGRLRLLRGAYKFSEEALDPACSCMTCRDFSRAYIHHLVKARESLGTQLIAHHNVHFYLHFMRGLRASILNGTFLDLYRVQREILMRDDPAYPIDKPQPKRQRVRPKVLGDFRVHLAPEGHASIQQCSSGEIMHSVSAPDDEARSLYLEQSQLVELAALDGGERELVVWDVGLGAGHNALALVHALEAEAARIKTRVRLVSFEKDLDALKLALQHPGEFKHVRHAAPHELLNKGNWVSSSVPLEWELLHGDFLQKLDEAPAPDVIFYDPFSFKTDSPLWSLECFQRVHAKAAVRGALLLTYSASTAVRATLLAAGFFVARGRASGPKSDTTVALAAKPSQSLVLDWLGQEWLARWEKSSAAAPQGLAADVLAQFSERVRQHPQFVS